LATIFTLADAAMFPKKISFSRCLLPDCVESIKRGSAKPAKTSFENRHIPGNFAEFTGMIIHVNKFLKE
jgi:hypothetical protein